ncbi:MAG: hypothetical protein BMS9Abin36_1157 [Gammaproteobacteria bacterium]|nr:MAG: hypothetical protein BMS9Abin36_1157 [Gammaproteobacteria bacterium]
MDPFELKAILVFVAIFVIVYFIRKINRTDREMKKIAPLIAKMERAVHFVNNGQSTSVRINNARKALELLQQINQYPSAAVRIQDREKLERKLRAFRMALPILEYIERADKNKFKGKKKPELDAILNALYYIKKHSITDEDLLESEFCDDDTGEVYSIGLIKERAKSLGWDVNSGAMS